MSTSPPYHPSFSHLGEHRTHSRFVKPPARVNIFFVRSAYLILSIVRLYPPTDSKIEIDRMQRFHCYTSCSPDSDSGGHALIAHQFPQLFHFTRRSSTKTALPTHWTPSTRSRSNESLQNVIHHSAEEKESRLAKLSSAQCCSERDGQICRDVCSKWRHNSSFGK